MLKVVVYWERPCRKLKTCASFAQPTTSFIVYLSCSFSRLKGILQHGILFFMTRVLSGEERHCTLVTFRMLQQATTLGYSLVACTPCLYCQATQPYGFKIEIAMQSFKTQEKWRSSKANHRRTRNKYDIFIKSIHSNLGIFILQTCDKFHSSVSNCCLTGRTQAHHYQSYFVCARIHCALSALGNESL